MSGKADAPYQRVRGHLARLGMEAAAECLAGELEIAQKEKPSYAEFLDKLIGAEVAAVEAKSHERRMRLAGFPSKRTLEEFDFSAQPNLDRRLIEELATLRFVEERSNVLFVGQPGVGKTMLAIALGLKAVDAGHRVYYTTAAELVARTAKAAPLPGWSCRCR